MIDKLKTIVFLWTVVSAIISGSIYYIATYKDLIVTHPLELGMLVLIVASSLITYFTFSDRVNKIECRVERGFDALHISQLKTDIDRFFKDHKEDTHLSEDDAAYLYMLRDKLTHYRVNSFSQRKVETLLKKDIK